MANEAAGTHSGVPMRCQGFRQYQCYTTGTHIRLLDAVSFGQKEPTAESQNQMAKMQPAQGSNPRPPAAHWPHMYSRLSGGFSEHSCPQVDWVQGQPGHGFVESPQVVLTAVGAELHGPTLMGPSALLSLCPKALASDHHQHPTPGCPSSGKESPAGRY